MVQQPKGPKLFVLDTNIFMHDPTALYRFEDNDIYLPMVVLEELDRHKTGISEVARNVRQINRMLVELMAQATHEELIAGLPITNYQSNEKIKSSGRLFFQTDDFEQCLPASLPGHNVDNTLLETAIGLQRKRPKQQVVIVSKDINLRIKAGILGIPAEDYYNDQVLDDVNLLHSGLHVLENEFWDTHSKNMTSWKEHGNTFYRIEGPLIEQWNPNDGITTEDNQFQGLVRQCEEGHALVQIARDYPQCCVAP